MRNLFNLSYKLDQFRVASSIKKMMFIAVLFLFSKGFGQVTSKIDTTSIRIGEQINYEIIVDQVKDVRFPKFESDSLNRVGVVTSHKIDSLKNQLIKKYAICRRMLLRGLCLRSRTYT